MTRLNKILLTFNSLIALLLIAGGIFFVVKFYPLLSEELAFKQAKTFDVLRTNRLEIYDEKNKIKAMLGLDQKDDGNFTVRLEFYNNDGGTSSAFDNDSLVISQNGLGWTDEYKEMEKLGSTKNDKPAKKVVEVYKSPLLYLGFSKNESPIITLLDTKNGRLRLGLNDKLKPNISLYDENGAVMTSIGVQDLIDDRGTQTIRSEASLIFFNKKNGKVSYQIP